jgi:hypothetical protein
MAYRGGRWIERLDAGDPILQAQITRRKHCESALNVARISVGLWPYGVGLNGDSRRGRPPLQHPLPRHYFNLETGTLTSSMGVFTPEEHRTGHRTEFYPGCRRCFQREKLYFEKHPERRPKGIQTSGSDAWGSQPDLKEMGKLDWDYKPGSKARADRLRQAAKELAEMQDFLRKKQVAATSRYSREIEDVRNGK